MSAFKSERDADAFALRAKHREWDDSDIEAVWDQALEELTDKLPGYQPSQHAIETQCIRILEERS